MKLDDLHRGMIELLREDGRMSIAALAEALSISRSNAYTRYEALREAGVITGVHAHIDPTKVGLEVAAMVFVTLHQSQWADFRARLTSIPELDYFAVTTGEHDAMLLVRAPDVAAVHELVATDLAKWPSIRATTTVFLMDELESAASIRPRPAPAAHDTGQRFGMTRFVRPTDGERRRPSR